MSILDEHLISSSLGYGFLKYSHSTMFTSSLLAKRSIRWPWRIKINIFFEEIDQTEQNFKIYKHYTEMVKSGERWKYSVLVMYCKNTQWY